MSAAPLPGNFDGLKTDKPETPGHLPGLTGATLAEKVKERMPQGTTTS